MQALVIEGMHPLRGSVPVHGSKNGALPLLAAALLAPGRTVLHHCPRLTDVQTTMEILRHLGAGCGWEGGTLWVDASAVTGTAIPEELMRRQRASVLFLGALLARCGEATLSTPGGCALGERPVDLHLSLLRQLGAEVGQQGDRIFCRGAALPGGEAYLSYPSVGATENFLLAAQGCAGPSRLLGAAMEPEIGELAELLCAMGARIEGVGTPVLTVYPAGALRSTEHTVRADRIEAATLLCAAVSAGGAASGAGCAVADRQRNSLHGHVGAAPCPGAAPRARARGDGPVAWLSHRCAGPADGGAAALLRYDADPRAGVSKPLSPRAGAAAHGRGH